MVGWPLHDIVINNMVWCIAHTRGGGGAPVAEWGGNAAVLQKGRLWKWVGAKKG